MKANFTDSSNSQAISQKFWSFVKNSSNTSRMSDEVITMAHYNLVPTQVDKNTR